MQTKIRIVVILLFIEFRIDDDYVVANERVMVEMRKDEAMIGKR